VSTLTPSQLARKRANDREAQRAIRARTKEHIERLEREIEELKSHGSRDALVQQLLSRNKELEQEVASLRDALGMQQAGRTTTYPPTPYQDTLSANSSTGTVSSRTSSFGQNSGDYNGLPSFQNSYIPTPEPCEPWQAGINNYPPSVVSSPASSIRELGADGYITGYIPTSVPSSMMDGSSIMSQTSVPGMDKGQYTYPQPPESQQQTCMQQQPWLLYPTYNTQSPPIQ